MPVSQLTSPLTRPLLVVASLLSLPACDDPTGRSPGAWADGDDEFADTDAADDALEGGTFGDGDDADDADDADDVGDPGLPPPPDVEPITGGSPGGLQQTVRIATNTGLCTGILLNPHTVLTAAHCVAPVKDIQWGTVSNSTTSSTFDRARVWTYEQAHEVAASTVGEAYDVAVISTNTRFDLQTDLGSTYATIATSRPDDNSGLWVNGRMDDGSDSGGIMHALTTIDPLPISDPRYPFQLLDTIAPVVHQGDSGGPLFRERPGETNDGQGGSIAPVVYGVVSRLASHARLDPIRGWINARASEILTAHDWQTGDVSWVTCDRDACPVYMTSDLGVLLPLGSVPRDTTMGVFVQAGDTLVVSYAMEDRDRMVQVVLRSDGFVNGGLAQHGPPPTEDLRIEDRYCAAAQCRVYSSRNLAEPKVTIVGTVGCGTRMGVFVKTPQWAVVGYPMEDRSRAVQVVGRNDPNWSTTAPFC